LFGGTTYVLSLFSTIASTNSINLSHSEISYHDAAESQTLLEKPRVKQRGKKEYRIGSPTRRLLLSDLASDSTYFVKTKITIW